MDALLTDGIKATVAPKARSIAVFFIGLFYIARAVVVCCSNLISPDIRCFSEKSGNELTACFIIESFLLMANSRYAVARFNAQPGAA